MGAAWRQPCAARPWLARALTARGHAASVQLRAAAAAAAAPTDGRWTLLRTGTAVVEVKRSRFLATAAPVATPEEAAALVRSLSDRSARHNCWAFRVGAVERCTDDGEPSGTAGRPLLAALGAADGALILVVRHFGGVLLGTGGLSRAYGAAASAAVADAGLSWEPHRVGASLACTFADRAAVEAALGACGAQREGEAPEGDGGERLLLRVSVPAAGAAGLAQALRNATAGRVQLDITQP